MNQLKNKKAKQNLGKSTLKVKSAKEKI